MKSPWFKVLEKALVIFLAGFVFWPKAVSSILLISLFVYGLARLYSKGIAWRSVLPHLAPLLLVIISWAIGQFAKDGWREIQLWLSWVAALTYFINSPNKELFTRAFQWFSLIQAIMVVAFIVFGKELPAEGYSHYLREYIQDSFKVHPTFLSTAWYWAAFLWLSNKANANWQRIVFGVFLVTAASLMGGKMPLLAITVVIFIWVNISLKKRWVKIISAGSLMLALTSLFVFSPVLSERLRELQNINLSFEGREMISSSELRIGIWQCAWTTTKAHWLTGVGLGNTRATLDDCYEAFHHPEFLAHEYNSHNQYLHFWLAGGVCTFTLFLLYWGWALRFSWRKGQMQLFYFLIYFMLVCLTENYFSRQFGMMFCAYMLFSQLPPLSWKLPHSSDEPR